MTVRTIAPSRLRFGEVLTLDGFEFWDLNALPNIPRQPDDIAYRVVANDRIDTLATRYYEDPNFWWVIAVANGFEILPTALNLGETITIPSPRFVRQALMKNTSGRR